MRRMGLRLTAGLSALLAMTLIGGTARAADQTVTIDGFAFSPGTVTVSEGEAVTWSNADGAAHTASGDGFDTERLDPGQSATVTFPSAGTFAYVCAIHPQMRGTVVVEAATSDGGGAPATGGGPTPAATDMVPMTPAARPDLIGLGAALLAVFGASMLLGTLWTSRRDRRPPPTRDD
jgi:plastocyanin